MREIKKERISTSVKTPYQSVDVTFTALPIINSTTKDELSVQFSDKNNFTIF
jgi:hypothetical protein